MKHDTAAIVGRAFSSPEIEFPEVSLAGKTRLGFVLTKRLIDIIFAVLALPIVAVFVVMLFVANSIWNPGPVFFKQVRMGRDRKPFTMWKFRTMTDDGTMVRAADAPLDEHRITPLGLLLRRTKLDELPNALNILAGDMSLVGPRPDAFKHATEYLGEVKYYGHRFAVRPGITGLAQVRDGYADDHRSVERKARYDCFYIKNSSIKLELYVIAVTIRVVLSGFGQR